MIAVQNDQFGPCEDRTPEAGIDRNWMEDGPSPLKETAAMLSPARNAPQ